MVMSFETQSSHQSPPARSPISLSPISSQFAAEAERESIHRLRQEVRGLSAALARLKRNSKEWVLIKSKLDIAKDELACMLEDRNLYRTFAADGEATKSNDEERLSFPTPPLGSKDNAIDQIIDSMDQMSSLFIRTPPLSAKPQSVPRSGECLSKDSTIISTISEPPLAAAERISSTECGESDVGGNDAEGSAPTPTDASPKYSLEWFRSKMRDEIESPTAETPENGHSSAQNLAYDTIPDGMGAEAASSDESLQKQMSALSSSSPMSEYPSASPNFGGLVEGRTPEIHDNLNASSLELQNDDIDELNAKLKSVPKYSIEWFTIKKHINNQQSGKRDNEDNDEQTKKAILRLKQIKHRRCQLPEESHYASMTKNSQDCIAPHNPTGSINGRSENAEEKMKYLRDQLKSVPKYSLDWFQTKKELEALAREKLDRDASNEHPEVSNSPDKQHHTEENLS